MPKRELSQEYPQKDGMKHIPKPMPKQDKGGGINLTAEGARYCPYRQQAAGRQTPPSLTLNTRETRV